MPGLTQTMSPPPKSGVRSDGPTPVIAKSGFKTFGFWDSAHMLHRTKRRRSSRPATTDSTSSDLTNDLTNEQNEHQTHRDQSDIDGEPETRKERRDQLRHRDQGDQQDQQGDQSTQHTDQSNIRLQSDQSDRVHATGHSGHATGHATDHAIDDATDDATDPIDDATDATDATDDMSALSNTRTASSDPDSFRVGMPSWPAPAVGETPQERQAGQLTSFSSRVKYSYDESENADAVPMAFPASTSTASAVAAAASSSSYTDQRASIRAQAVRIRNQLDMKFGAISFSAQLDELTDQFSPPHSVPHYNPSRTIRDRSDARIAPHMPRRPSKTNIWQISVAELTQDSRWRFNHERAEAHKERRKVTRAQQDRRRSQKEGSQKEAAQKEAAQKEDRRQKRAQRHASHASVSRLENLDSPSPSSPYDATYETPPRSTSGSGSGSSSVYSDPDLTTNFLANFVPKGHKSSDSRDDGSVRKDEGKFTGSSPQSQCTESINRLRTSHDDNEIASFEDESGDEHRGSFKQNTRSGSTNSTGASSAALVECDGPVNPDEHAWAKRRFCRNSASVANTWNRSYRPRRSSTVSDSLGTSPPANAAVNAAVNAAAGNAVSGGSKAPSSYSLGSSSGMSRRSSYTSETDEKRPSVSSHASATAVPTVSSLAASVPAMTDSNRLTMFCTNAASAAATASQSESTTAHGSSSSSTENLSKNGSAGRLADAPMLVSTPENGSEVVLDSGKSRRGSAALLGAPVPSLNNKPANSSGALTSGTAASNLWLDGEFGSLSNDTIRRDPYEKKCAALDADSRYLVAYYETASRRPGPKEVSKSANDLELARFGSSGRSSGPLKDGIVTDFSKDLSGIENQLVQQQQELDANVATSSDGSRVATDLMVSEVNTTSNRRIREIGSRMERSSARNTCEVYTNASYLTIEYVVSFVMWAIWCLVKLARSSICPIKGVRYVCDNLIVA